MSKKRIAKMKYEFKAGARYSVAADVAGAELERIQNQRGVIEPRVVVEESRPEAAPLHPFLNGTTTRRRRTTAHGRRAA
jgi:hypothetical protein